MEFLIYFGLMYVYMLSPGPSMALISCNSAKFGISKTHAIIFGVVTSITFYTLLSILGIAAVVKHYPNAFKAVKIVGSCYIIFIGVKMFIVSFKAKIEKVKEVQKDSSLKQFFLGLTTDLANPLSFIGITSMILGFVNVTDAPNVKIIYFLTTVLCGFAYAYTYAYIFGNPISRKFITPRMPLVEKFAGIAISLVGCTFLIGAINS